MANPLSSYGYSDRDYAAAVGTLMGEAYGQGVEGYAGVADVIANRLQDPHAYGARTATISAVAKNPSQFQAWDGTDPRARGGFINAKNGFAAALNANLVDKLGLKEEMPKVNDALVGVFGTGQLRGITQGATFYQNAPVTAQWGTGAYQAGLAGKYGSTVIGDHVFTGPDFRPDQPFDPVTYNGQLTAPPAAEPFFGDVAMPVGRVDFAGDLPDISSPAVPVGQVDFGGYLPDLTPSPDYSGITAGTAFDPMSSFSPVDPAAPNFADVQGPTYPDITAGLYDAPTAPAPSGYHTGVGEDPYGGIGPDFSAPSFDAWSNTDSQLARAHDTALGMGAYSSDLNPEAIADRLNKELGPQAPQLAAQTQAAAPSWSDYQPMDFSGLSFTSPPQAQPAQPSASSWSDYTPQDFSGLSFTTPEEAGIPAAPGSQPATTSSIGPVGWDDHTGLTIGGFHSPAEALGFGKPSNDFMDAMANPEIAKGYQSGFNLGPIGITGTGHLTVGGFNSPMDMIGSLFGQTPQQTVTQPHGFGLGGILGSIGSMFGGGGNGLAGAMVPNGTGGYRPADMMDAMSNPDIANRVRGSGFFGGLGNMFGGWGNAFGSGGLFGGSEGYYGGGNNGPGSSRGDGSYADSAGYSSNDPQGIL